mmetsp:Transcript_11184/g.46964  ORF Transcript_11184/g.46964 Transcript_11184/m.46964 type:complete len:280 (+) Transcript_11184:494-1333(+)
MPNMSFLVRPGFAASAFPMALRSLHRLPVGMDTSRFTPRWNSKSDQSSSCRGFEELEALTTHRIARTGLRVLRSQNEVSSCVPGTLAAAVNASRCVFISRTSIRMTNASLAARLSSAKEAPTNALPSTDSKFPYGIGGAASARAQRCMSTSPVSSSPACQNRFRRNACARYGRMSRNEDISACRRAGVPSHSATVNLNRRSHSSPNASATTSRSRATAGRSVSVTKETFLSYLKTPLPECARRTSIRPGYALSTNRLITRAIASVLLLSGACDAFTGAP